MVMAGMSGTTPSSELLARVRAGEVGGVILFGSNIASHAQVRDAVQTLQAEAARGGNPPLLISADQEGGSIRRFADAPPVSPRSISTADEATTQGRATGNFLHGEGVNVNLAPIADV